MYVYLRESHKTTTTITENLFYLVPQSTMIFVKCVVYVHSG